MPSRILDFPVFDADNHLYETPEALTRYLPDHQRGAIDYIDVHGRTKIVVRGQITDYIPNPTFERIGQPGALEDYFRNGNPEGRPYRELLGRELTARRHFAQRKIGSSSWMSKVSTTRSCFRRWRASSKNVPRTILT